MLTHDVSPACPGAACRAAPEVLTGETKCSEKVDCYSLGVVLWEIVTGEVPKRGGMRNIRWGAGLPSFFLSSLRSRPPSSPPLPLPSSPTFPLSPLPPRPSSWPLT